MSSTTSRNQVRIIAGKWRGRKLDFPDAEGLRPTGDRIRETLFNWLQRDLPGSRCLDLFAGSGALGFEALSRGAKSVLLLEKQRKLVDQLQQHKQRLGAENCQILQQDSLLWLQQGLQQGPQQAETRPFDIIFLDPPYAMQLLPQCFQLIEQKGWLREGGLLYVEQAQNQNLSLSSRWQTVRNKRSGQVEYSLLIYGESA